MKHTSIICFALLWFATSCATQPSAQTATERPHLRKQGTATQLIVDGKPFLAVSGELGNNSATSLEHMEPIWPVLTSGNLNSALVAVHWAQVEPEEGRFEFELLDGLIKEARNNNLKLVLLWFGSWKNGLSSYTPDWVKRDYKKYPRIRLGGGGTIELLSTFGEASRDADARAFRALMRHIKEVDGRQHTVIMVQVENEVGVLRDSRDRSEPANQAFAGPVPQELMDYLREHRDTLAPELLGAWEANGFKSSGTWEEVFGPGKPDSVVIPIQTRTPPMSPEEHAVAFRQLHWPADEIFMAWNYSRYIGKIIEEGKAEYDIPMFVNAWLQQANHAWPGSYPSGGPLPQVHDIWRAGAPACDILTPDIYVPYFDEIAEKYIRNSNPLFVPETSANALNALVAFGKYGAIGFSPFFIERRIAPESDLATAYRLISEMAPAIAAHQGTDRITAVRMTLGDPPLKVELGDYTLELTFVGNRRVPIAPTPPGADQGRPGQTSEESPVHGAAILVASGPDEYFMVSMGGAMRITLSPKTPGPSIVGLADVQEGKFVDGTWTVIRQLGGDDTGQGEILALRPNRVMRVGVYRYE